MLISIASEKHEHHPAEASAMLFQIFVQIARLYAHKASKNDAEWVEDLHNFIPPFIVYAEHVAANRGEAATKQLLVKMYEEASRVFFTAVRAAHNHPNYRDLEKTASLYALLANKNILPDVVKYGVKFIDHVVEGKDENVKSIVKDLVAITTTHRNSHWA